MPDELPTAAPWLTADAERWLAAREPQWTKGRFLLPQLLAALVLAIGFGDDAACTPAQPCGPEWLNWLFVVAVVGNLVWYVRLPRLTVVAVATAGVLLPLTSGLHGWTVALLVICLAQVAAGALRRVLARRSQARLARAASGQSLPAPLSEPAGGWPGIVFGALLCAGAVGAVGHAVWTLHVDQRHVQRAKVVSATVQGRDTEDGSLDLLLPGGSRRTVSSLHPEYYADQTTVPVLEDGSWLRLQAERPDLEGEQLLAMGLFVLGIGPLVASTANRARRRALHRGPMPALAVLSRMDKDGVLWIHPADDPSGLLPLLECQVAPATALDPEQRFQEIDAEDADGEPHDARVIDALPRAAVLLGSPSEGAQLAVLEAGPHGPVPLLTVAPARTGGPRSRPTRSEPDPPTEPALLDPSPHPRSWGPAPAQRVLGVLLLAVLLLFAGPLMPSGSWISILGHSLLALYWASTCAQLLHWRVLTDRSGLHLTGRWRVRSVPWSEVRSVRAAENGGLTVVLTTGEWTAPGERLGARVLGIHAHAQRAAAELTALQEDPALRPTEDAGRRSRSLPAAPFVGAAVLAVVLWSAFG